MIMKKITLCFVVAAALLLILQSCEKKSVKAYYPIPGEMLSFISHTTGSYYIYKDSATGITDSVIVTASDLVQKKEYSLPSGDTYLADYFHLVLEKASPSGVLSPWLDAEVEKPGYEAYLRADIGNGRSLFWFPYYRSQVFEKINAATINGVSYQDVHCFNMSNGETCWWVRNVGIIKITNLLQTGEQTFTLVRKG